MTFKGKTISQLLRLYLVALCAWVIVVVIFFTESFTDIINIPIDFFVLPLNHEKSNTTIPTRNYSDPHNLHKYFSIECGKYPDLETFHPSILPLFELGIDYQPNQTHNKIGHAFFRGNSTEGLRVAGFLQSCAYSALIRFWKLSKEYNIDRWSAHGGTAMASFCHNSMNPWDDDLDITLANCSQIDAIFDTLGEVSVVHPDLPPRQYSYKEQWVGRLLDHEWILIKGNGYYYKLKSVAEIRSRSSHDLGGMDIMCFPDMVRPPQEKNAMVMSGFKDQRKFVCYLLL